MTTHGADRSSQSSQRRWPQCALPLRLIHPSLDKTSIAAPQPIACPSGTKSSRDYALNMMGNRAGYQTVCLQADGTRLVRFAFNDRGRGPALTSTIRLDARGIPVAIATDGNDYFKGPVAERFTRAAGAASWKNKVESGTQPVAGAAFYVSQSGSPRKSACSPAHCAAHRAASWHCCRRAKQDCSNCRS